MTGTMRAWAVETPGPIESGPLHVVERPIPVPGPGEVLARVLACGVCRTDLHVAEGDLPVHRQRVTPGHEVVGEVITVGPDVATPRPGDRIGIAWLRHTCGECDHCRRGAENLCPHSRYTGWDADGGYAEYAVAPAAYVYSLPAGYSDAELAPLLCAGIIGYRALQRASPHGDGDIGRGRAGALGVYGFGGSAHLATQVALARGARVHVMTRDAASRALALELGCASAQGTADAPPEPLDAAILFAPVGDLVPVALRALDRGGILSIAGIHLSRIPPLDYEREVFYEREIRSVTSNRREDGRAFLAFAAEHPLRVETTQYPLDAADRALADLKRGAFAGAAVLVP